MSGYTIQATVGNGHTLEEFMKVLDQRVQYLQESSHDALTACALDILRSIRVETTIAKLSSTKTDNVKDAPNLQLSYRTDGSKKIPCLRIGKTRYVKKPTERIVFDSLDKCAKVFTWDYERGEKQKLTYIIVANSINQAKRKVKEIVKKRMMAYRGLAKRAISLLMMKTFSQSIADNVNTLTENVAQSMTSKIERVSNGMHVLSLKDDLDYALAALKHGQNSIDIAMMKASNKIVSKINMKCKNLLGFEKLETPFPEVRQRK